MYDFFSGNIRKYFTDVVYVCFVRTMAIIGVVFIRGVRLGWLGSVLILLLLSLILRLGLIFGRIRNLLGR